MAEYTFTLGEDAEAGMTLVLDQSTGKLVPERAKPVILPPTGVNRFTLTGDAKAGSQLVGSGDSFLRPVVDPLLVSDASRRAHQRYLTTGDDPHEILADAIRTGEDRGIEAALMVVLDLDGKGVTVNDIGQVRLTNGVWIDKLALMRQIERRLGRGQ